MTAKQPLMRLTLIALLMAGLSACASTRCKNDAPYTRAVAYPPLESAGAVSAPAPSQEFRIPPAGDGAGQIAATESGCLDEPPMLEGLDTDPDEEDTDAT